MWKILPADQQEVIKNYAVRKVIVMSSDKATISSEQVFIIKLNLVQLLSGSDGDRGGEVHEGESEWGVLVDIPSVQVHPGAQQTSLMHMMLQHFLRWIPLGFIFQMPLIKVLLDKFFPELLFHNDALECLTEIGNLL
eukprot:9871212-Ditylum_brightwellii.AAC.1